MAEIRGKLLVVTYYDDIRGNGFASYVAKAYDKSMLKFLLGKAVKIIITQQKHLNFSPYLGKHKNKIEVVPIGVDIERFKPLVINRKKNKYFS